MKQAVIDLVERGLVPDTLTRFGMRRMIGDRLEMEQSNADLSSFFDFVTEGPIAEDVDLANSQHYEVPDAFYQLVLGPNLKYSSCFYEQGDEGLLVAEETMLAMTCARAELKDGQDILELGCGWGSLSLYMASHFPNAKITAVSNSSSQREYIEGQAAKRGLNNLTVLTANVGTLSIDRQFDRVVSVEMFEHMRNYAALTDNVRNWLREDGLAFVHIFCHRTYGYLFEVKDANDWMAENFFTGGIMPSFDIFERTSDALTMQHKWWIDGTHYEKTLNAWLDLLDQKRDEATELFMTHYGESRADARRRVQRWRMFFMASAELFGFADGKEWGVGHFLLRPVS